jgi:hypothetical protein
MNLLELTSETIEVLRRYGPRVALECKAIGQSGLLRRYHAGGESSGAISNSIMNIIKNRIITQPKSSITLTGRPEDRPKCESSRRELHFGNSKENWGIMANLQGRSGGVRATGNKLQRHLHSESQLTVDNRQQPSDNKHDQVVSTESGQLMMSRISWLFELRNLFDKLKRKSSTISVGKEQFIIQLKRVVGVGIFHRSL